jgi:hypothetical protein
MATSSSKKAAPKKAAPKKSAPQRASAAKASGSTRGRAQDRSKVASGQNYEVAYESRKTGKSTTAVKAAVKSAGNSRKKVEAKLKGR